MVVPVAVRARCCTQRPQRCEREVLPVLHPFLASRQRRLRACDLAVGVDRVAEIDVEIVALGGHTSIDLEVVVGRLAVRSGRCVGIARDREAHCGPRRARRRRAEAPQLARGASLAEAVQVRGVRLQTLDRDAHCQVVRLTGGCRGYDAEPDDVPDALGELQADLPGSWRPRPEQRARRGNLAGRHAVRKGGDCGRRAARQREDGGAADGGCEEPHAPTLTKGTPPVDTDSVRTFLLTVAALAVLAVPAGARRARPGFVTRGMASPSTCPRAGPTRRTACASSRKCGAWPETIPSSPPSSTTCWQQATRTWP